MLGCEGPVALATVRCGHTFEPFLPDFSLFFLAPLTLYHPGGSTGPCHLSISAGATCCVLWQQLLVLTNEASWQLQ